MSDMTIGELARRTGLAVRTLRFYADAGGCQRHLAASPAIGCSAPMPSLARVCCARCGSCASGWKTSSACWPPRSRCQRSRPGTPALDAQIRTLRLQRAELSAVATSTSREQLHRMTELTSLTADARRRILDDYLEAVFDDHDSPVADRLRTGAPALPDDPSADQVAAWIELVELLRDPDSDGGHEATAAIAEHAGAAARGGVTPASPRRWPWSSISRP